MDNSTAKLDDIDAKLEAIKDYRRKFGVFGVMGCATVPELLKLVDVVTELSQIVREKVADPQSG